MSGYKFDDDGNIVPITVIIVCGPPASGKTTYVRKHRKVGDIVVDLDLLKDAIGMTTRDEATYGIVEVAISIRDYIIKQIRGRKIEQDVWLITTTPPQADRWAKELHGRVYDMSADKDECIKRAMADDSRTDKAEQVRIINEWFDKWGKWV